MIKLVISGIAGRMGTLIGLLASSDRRFELSGGLESPKNSAVGKDIGVVLGFGEAGAKVEADFSKLIETCDVLIEFTAPEPTIAHLKEASNKKIGMVIGTTGLSPQQVEKIKEASLKIPIVFSPNMSVGANLLFKIAEDISMALDKSYEVEIVEAHHSGKKDAPSGTAKRLGDAVSKSRGKFPVIHSIRLGDIAGDHTVIFAGKGERIELTHRAHSRDAFAKGALDAAEFVAGQKPGLYTMHDVIKLGRDRK